MGLQYNQTNAMIKGEENYIYSCRVDVWKSRLWYGGVNAYDSAVKMLKLGLKFEKRNTSSELVRI
jgi:hypothetical protein